MSQELWQKETIGKATYTLMNLKHSEVDRRVIEDMEQGVDVYYDRRWETTGVLTEWLETHCEIFAGEKILILGAGVGAETLVLAKHGEHVWLNDLSPTALELCREQLDQNKLENHTSLLGRYEELELPEVDLVVASFLIYNDDTFTAMRNYMKAHQGRLILVNERLAPFPKFLEMEAHEILFEINAAVGVLFTRE